MKGKERVLLVAMAMVSTSLVSQVSGPKSTTTTTTSSYSPLFSGLRRSCSKLESNPPQSLFQHVDSHLRLSSPRKGCRGVVAMAGSGKVVFPSHLFRSNINVLQTFISCSPYILPLPFQINSRVSSFRNIIINVNVASLINYFYVFTIDYILF